MTILACRPTDKTACLCISVALVHAHACWQCISITTTASGLSRTTPPSALTHALTHACKHARMHAHAHACTLARVTHRSCIHPTLPDWDACSGVTTTNDAFCWGNGANGRLGTDSTATVAVPTLVSGGYQFASITVGGAHACALTTQGVALCWGAWLWGGGGLVLGACLPSSPRFSMHSP